MHAARCLAFVLGLAAFANAQDPTRPAPSKPAAPQAKSPAPRAKGAARTGAPVEPEEADAQGAYSALQAVSEFQAMVERDRRISFGALTHAAALREFDRWSASDTGRAAALVALGGAQIGAERARLESYAREGAAELRQAALLALGELRGGDLTLLRDFASRRGPLAEYALFALARQASPAALAAVNEIAAQEAHPLNAAARDALGFSLTPAVESPVARRYLELRFEAARRFGLVDGQAWETLLVSDLSRNHKFLSRVVYRAAAELSQPGIKDHFLEVALAGGGPERLRGVVRAMPTEFARLVDEDLLVLEDERDWITVLEEIDARNLEGVTAPVLRRAWMSPHARVAATVLLGRSHTPGSTELMNILLRAEDPNARAAAAQAMVYAPREEALALLAAAENDAEERVRAAVWVAQFRLGGEAAATHLRTTLQTDETSRLLADLREAQSRGGAAAGRDGGGAAARGGRGSAEGARGQRPQAEQGGDKRGAEGAQDAEREPRRERVAKATERLTPLPGPALILVEALIPAAGDRRVRELLSIARVRTPDALRLRIDTELALYGDSRARTALREGLLELQPRGGVGARAVAALAHGAGLADLEVLREMFPVGDDIEVDSELACALIAQRDAEVLPILRASLWSEPWNRSVLAGALLVAHGGLDLLRAELTRPPAGVSERDLRRVGFALGEWGGASEVDRLAARVGAADPALQGALLGALGARTH